jgi:hypothetical protein
MIGSAPGMGHAVCLQIIRQLAREITGAVATQQPGFVPDLDLVQPGKEQRIIEGICNITGARRSDYLRTPSQ